MVSIIGIIFLIFITEIKGFIRLKFKRNIKTSQKFGKDLLNELYINNLEIPIQYGVPERTMKFSLSSDSYPTYIHESILGESATMNPIKDAKNYDFELFKEASIASDAFKYDSNKLGIYYFFVNKNYNFGKTEEHPNFKAVIGLRVFDANMKIIKENIPPRLTEETNFFKQYCENKKIDNCTVALKYTGENEGELLVGKLPHEIDNNYNKEDYFFTKVYMGTQTYAFDLKIGFLKYGGNDVTKNINKDGYITGFFKTQVGFMYYPGYLRDMYQKEFFNKTKACKKVIMNNENQYSFVCDKNVDFSKFKSTEFGFSEHDYSFTLTYKDLFYFNEEDQKYYFLVKFNRYHFDCLYLGAPFLRKYMTVFDQQKNVIGFYKGKQGIYSENKVFWVLFFMALVVCIILAFFIVRNYCLRKRKENADELENKFVKKSEIDPIE